MKRTLIIVASLIFVIGIVAVLYYLYFAPSAQLTVSSGTGTFPGSGTGNTSDASGEASTAKTVAPNFVEITSSPVSAGEVAFDIAPTEVATTTTLSTSTIGTAAIITQNSGVGDAEVRYIDRESGNVYTYDGTTHALTRVSDKTLPGIQEASWLPDGSMAFVQFLADVDGSEHVNTYALPYNGADGYFLEQDLSQVLAIGSSTLFTLNANTDGSVGSIARSDGTNAQTLFTSPLTSIVARASGSTILAVTKASAELNGYAFTLSPSGNFTPILGPLTGLTILPSPDGQKVLFSYVDSGGTLHMSVLNLTSGVTTQLPLATLAEKCVWTADSTALYCAIPTSFTGTLPDDWYQGVVSFTDRIWRIDLTSRLATLVVDPTAAAKVSIDAVNLTIDPNSQLLVFRNKKDGSLWAYSL